MLSNAARMCTVFHKQPWKLRLAKRGDMFGERLCSKLYSKAQRGGGPVWLAGGPCCQCDRAGMTRRYSLGAL